MPPPLSAPPPAPSTNRNVLFVVGLVILLCGFNRACSSCSNKSSTSTTSTRGTTSDTTAARPVRTPAEQKADYMERVEREITSLSSNPAAGPRDTEAQLVVEMAMYSAYAMVLREASSHDLTDAEKAKVRRLHGLVVRAQQRAFPAIRRAWVASKRQAMWENDVEVSATGTGARTISFTAAMFAANRNIQTVQESIRENLCLFRFGRSQYRWYRSASEYTYYTMSECPKDSDIGTFSGRTFLKVEP